MDNEDGERHRKLQAFFKAANALYLAHPELWELDFSWEGFEWIEANDNQANTVAFLRKDKKGDALVVVCNFSPVDRTGYTVGVPVPGTYTCIFSSDDPAFGGGGQGDVQPVKSRYIESQGKEQSITLRLPAMSAAIYKCTRKFPARRKKAVSARAEAAAKTPKAAPAEKKLPARAVKAAVPAKAEKAPAPVKAEKAPVPAKVKKAAVPARAEKAPAPAKAEKAPAPARAEKAAKPAKKR